MNRYVAYAFTFFFALLTPFCASAYEANHIRIDANKIVVTVLSAEECHTMPECLYQTKAKVFGYCRRLGGRVVESDMAEIEHTRYKKNCGGGYCKIHALAITGICRL